MNMQADGKLRRISPFFVPSVLANMAAGCISIRCGLEPDDKPTTCRPSLSGFRSFLAHGRP